MVVGVGGLPEGILGGAVGLQRPVVLPLDLPVARLQAEDPRWLVNGRRGVVQARL